MTLTSRKAHLCVLGLLHLRVQWGGGVGVMGLEGRVEALHCL